MIKKMKISKPLQTFRKDILRIAAKYGAHHVCVFGSMARNEAGPNSDLDLLVEFEDGRSLLDHAGLMLDLQELIGRKVDIVTKKSVHWYIRDRVLREAIPL